MTTFEDSGWLRLLYELGCAFAARVELDDLVAAVIEAGGYPFTSSLPLSVLKLAAPIINPRR